MKSTTKLIIVATVVMLAALLASPVAARGNAGGAASVSNNTIKFVDPGDVIFEYETGLALTHIMSSTLVTGPTELRKYVDDDPTKALINTIPIGNPDSFDVLSASVGGNYGVYYPFNATVYKAGAIQIRPPAVTLGVVLANSLVDSVDGKSLTRDNSIAFKVSAPFLGAFFINGSWGAVGSATERFPLAVRIQTTTPGGGKVNVLNGITLNPVYLNGTEFFTNGGSVLNGCPGPSIACQPGPIPLTGIEAGTYTAVAKFVNTPNLTSGLQDRAPDSNAVTFTVLSKPLTITTNKETVTRGNPFVVTITGESRKAYYVYVRNQSTTAGFTIPLMTPGQVAVNTTMDSDGVLFKTTAASQLRWLNASLYPSALAGVQPSPTDAPNIDRAEANVSTAADGSRSIQFDTVTTTDDKKFTIKVIDKDDVSKYDQVDVTVEKGKVTITYEGTGSYYLGETIKLTGTNTDNKTVYLALKGPNLDEGGVSMADIICHTDGVTPNAPAQCGMQARQRFKVVDVNTDNTWVYKWDTSKLSAQFVSLDAGTYTVYAVASPVASLKSTDLSNAAYETASVVLKKPFITASASTNTLAKGDKLFIRGTAEGKPTNVFVWLFGKNYRRLAASANVRSDATYEYKLDRGDTSGLYAGQYFAVVQHPMMNGIADIIGVGTDSAGVVGLPSGTWTFGNPTVKLAGLQASDAATALVDLLNSPNVDDTYTKLSFMIEEAWIRIDTIGDKFVGDTFKITGTTNLAEGDTILMTVTSSSFKPTEKTQTGEFSGSSGSVTVQKGDTYNTFSFDVDASTFKPDEYLVKAESIEPSQTATATFNVLEGQATTAAPATTPPAAVTTAPAVTTPPAAATTAAPVTTAKPQPGFGALVALVGLGAVALLVLRRR